MIAFEPHLEGMRPDLLAQIQLERLQALLARLKRNVRRYRELLGSTRVDTLEDIAGLPFTTPEDLVSAFPYGMFALPLREVVRLHSTLGPEGRQLVIGHTRNDLKQWGRLAARELVGAGVTSNDVVQICFAGGSLCQSMGTLLGAELVGASVIPEDPQHIEYQLEVLENYRATGLVTTPGNARDLAELLAQEGRDPQSLQLRTLLLTRPVSQAERDELATGLFARVCCGFGVPEIVDPGIAVECDEGRLHVNEDHFLVETDAGELIVTTLTREAMPLLRYRTRMGGEIRRERCACGRSGLTLQLGERLDDRLLVNETPVYRNQIAAVLGKTPAAGQPFSLRIGERQVGIDLEVSADFFRDQMRILADLKNTIRSEFLSRLGIEVDVRYVSPEQDGASGTTERPKAP